MEFDLQRFSQFFYGFSWDEDYNEYDYSNLWMTLYEKEGIYNTYCSVYNNKVKWGGGAIIHTKKLGIRSKFLQLPYGISTYSNTKTYDCNSDYYISNIIWIRYLTEDIEMQVVESSSSSNSQCKYNTIIRYKYKTDHSYNTEKFSFMVYKKYGTPTGVVFEQDLLDESTLALELGNPIYKKNNKLFLNVNALKSLESAYASLKFYFYSSFSTV